MNPWVEGREGKIRLCVTKLKQKAARRHTMLLLGEEEQQHKVDL